MMLLNAKSICNKTYFVHYVIKERVDLAYIPKTRLDKEKKSLYRILWRWVMNFASVPTWGRGSDGAFVYQKILAVRRALFQKGQDERPCSWYWDKRENWGYFHYPPSCIAAFLIQLLNFIAEEVMDSARLLLLNDFISPPWNWGWLRIPWLPQ